MTLLGKILAFLRLLFASLLWFAAAPKDWDSDLEDFEVKMEGGYFTQNVQINEIKQNPKSSA